MTKSEGGVIRRQSDFSKFVEFIDTELLICYYEKNVGSTMFIQRIQSFSSSISKAEKRLNMMEQTWPCIFLDQIFVPNALKRPEVVSAPLVWRNKA